MTLQDIYDQLAYGELRLLNLGSGNIDSDGAFPVKSFMKVLPTIQLGLTELHKKFLLREGHIHVPLEENKVTYVIKKDHPEDFDENLLKIERVYGKLDKKPYEIPLNRIGNKEAVRTTSYNTLLVPTDKEEAPWLKETNTLHIVYRADHPKLNKIVAQKAPLVTQIDLPVTYLQALLYFIASRMHNPVGMNKEFHEGNNYAAKYETELAYLQMMNYQIDSDSDDDRIIDSGWV